MAKYDPFVHKKKEARNNLILGVLMLSGFSGAVFSGCTALVHGNGKFLLLAVYTVMAFLGLGFLLLGIDERKLYKKFSPYAKWLPKEGILSADQAASMTRTASDIVRVDIETMIRKGYIQHTVPNEDRSGYTAYIGNTGIRMEGEIPKTDKQIEQEKKNPSNSVQPQIISVNCPSCGGLNRVAEGSSCVCEYCGCRIEN